MTDWTFTDWQLIYDVWDPSRQPLREALCTLGNGHFATRGAFEEARAGGPHYPGTYLACGYNRLETELAGRVVENEDLVNWPNWLPLTFRHEGGEWFDLGQVEVLEFCQTLDVRRGLLERRVRFRDPQDRVSRLESRRLIHMGVPHLAAMAWTLTPENWSGPIEIRSAIDATVRNEGVERYKDLNNKHFQTVATERVGEDGVLLTCETNQSHIRMAQAARTRVFLDGGSAVVQRSTLEEDDRIAQHLLLVCERQKPVRVEKVAALYTSRDHAISEPTLAARTAIGRAEGFDHLLASHQHTWSHLWSRCDIELEGDPRSQFVVRLHIFHLLQTASMNTVDRDIGIPARGWHGEAYRGHIFWDELFIFQFLNLSIPEIARELLMYRYRRLGEARHAAQEAGCRGAMFPWQSGSSGREESQVVHLNPRSGRWVPDNSHQQRHVGAAIAYNAWQHYEATGDREFLSFYGAELILEIARFWASIATYHPEHDRYEIRGIMGPDEFHTKYPDRDELGLDNNAYTNLMAVWVIRCAQSVLARLPDERCAELVEKLQIDDEEFRRWDEVSRKMFVPFQGDGLISQFEGYENLEEFDWEGYRAKYGDIGRLDRILEAEGDTVNRYKASKQADVLMLFYLFSSEELVELFARLGYTFDPAAIPKNIDYYQARTSHGSTLSRVVHSWVLARANREGSWGLFQAALGSDVSDIQGGTTPEGIHLGAMAGTVDCIGRCYTGISVRDDVLWLNPRLPRGATDLHGLRMRLRYRGHWLRLEVTRQMAKVRLEPYNLASAKIGFVGRVHELAPDESRTFQLASD